MAKHGGTVGERWSHDVQTYAKQIDPAAKGAAEICTGDTQVLQSAWGAQWLVITDLAKAILKVADIAMKKPH